LPELLAIHHENAFQIGEGRGRKCCEVNPSLFFRLSLREAIWCLVGSSCGDKILRAHHGGSKYARGFSSIGGRNCFRREVEKPWAGTVGEDFVLYGVPVRARLVVPSRREKSLIFRVHLLGKVRAGSLPEAPVDVSALTTESQCVRKDNSTLFAKCADKKRLRPFGGGAQFTGLY